MGARHATYHCHDCCSEFSWDRRSGSRVATEATRNCSKPDPNQVTAVECEKWRLALGQRIVFRRSYLVCVDDQNKVRSGIVSGLDSRQTAVPGWAVRFVCSLDDLVGNGEQIRRHREAEHCGSLQIDHQLEFGRL